MIITGNALPVDPGWVLEPAAPGETALDRHDCVPRHGGHGARESLIPVGCGGTGTVDTETYAVRASVLPTAAGCSRVRPRAGRRLP
jgi:hypothetical protein